MVRKKIFILVIILLVGILGGGFYVCYQYFHAVPFERNGEKEAMLFRDYGDYQVHDLEYVGTTPIIVEGEVTRPVFCDKKFSGVIEVDYFSRQKIMGQFVAQDVVVEKNNRMERIAVYQHLLGSDSQPLAGFPVDLRLFFREGMQNEILKVSWERRGDYVYWLVCGAEDEKEARKVLEEFFAWPKEDVSDVLFY